MPDSRHLKDLTGKRHLRFTNRNAELDFTATTWSTLKGEPSTPPSRPLSHVHQPVVTHLFCGWIKPLSIVFNLEFQHTVEVV